MANVISRIARGITRIPGRILAAAGWPYLEPACFGVGTTHTGDLDALETVRRLRREALRRPEDQDPPPAT
jgi:hypothetical protein